VKMSIIEKDSKIMRKVTDQEIERFSKLAKENPTNPKDKPSP